MNRAYTTTTAINVLGASLLALAGIVIANYLLSASALFQGLPLSFISLKAALLASIIGLALLYYSWQRYEASFPENNITWYTLPLTLAAILIGAGSLGILKVDNIQDIDRLEMLTASYIESSFVNKLQEQAHLSEAMKEFLLGKENLAKEFAQLAPLYLKLFIGIKSIWLLDSSLQTIWTSDPKQKLVKKELTISSHTQIKMLPLENDETTAHFLLYTPLFKGETFVGMIVSLNDLNLFISSLLANINKEKYAVTFTQQGQKIYSTAAATRTLAISEDKWARLAIASPINIELQVAALDQEPISYLPPLLLWLLSLGALSLLTLGSLIYYFLTSQRQAFALASSSRQLEQARISLINQEKLASLGGLIAGIAHEIKNPLNFIQNFAELAMNINQEAKAIFFKNESKLDERDKTGLQEAFKSLESNLAIINKQTEKATNTLRRMLLHTRNKNDNLVSSDLHHLLEEYLSLFYHSIRAKAPNFNLKIEKSFGIAYGRVKVHAEDISRVFLNLLNNAYYALNIKKANLGLDFVPIIKVKTQIINNFFEIHINDNGDGISPEIAKSIFSPFFTTKPAGQGTGLGLYLSRSIIEQEHGGSLTFISKEGVFTEFIIKLPITEAG